MTITLLAISPANRGTQGYDATLSADGKTTLCVVPGDTLTACVVKAASVLTRMGAEETISEPVFGPGVSQLVDSKTTPEKAPGMPDNWGWVLGYLAASGPVESPENRPGTFARMVGAFEAAAGSAPEHHALVRLLNELHDEGFVDIETHRDGTVIYQLPSQGEPSAPGAEPGLIDGLTEDAHVVLAYMQHTAKDIPHPEYNRSGEFTRLATHLRDSTRKKTPGLRTPHERAAVAMEELDRAGLLQALPIGRKSMPVYTLTTAGKARIPSEVN